MIIPNSIILTVIYIVFTVILFTAFWGAWSAAPWVPTFRKDTKRMVDLAEIKEGDVIYDLGSGDGRLVFEAVKRGAKGTGIEIFILPWLYSWIISLFNPNAKMLFGNMFKKDISDADVVFIYLLDKCYQKVMAKLKNELKPGARVVVACWPIKGMENNLIKRDKPEGHLTMYLYRI